MRILLVEDKPDFAEAVEKSIRRIDGCELAWAKSKAGALAALADEPFDVVILDRGIPSEDEVLDDHPNHGLDVFLSIKENQPGTCVWFLTGAHDLDFPISVLNEHSKHGDVHARGGTESIYRVFWKHKMPECVAAVLAFRTELQRTEAVNVVTSDPLQLRQEEYRLLRLFGRYHNGTTVEVWPLAGGLSGARVLRVTAFNSLGQPILTSVAKVGLFSEIDVERSRYRNEVIKLAAGSFPQITFEINLGASRFAAIFYGVVGKTVKNLFDKLVADPAAGGAVPESLRGSQTAWIGAKQVAYIRVAAIRRKLIGDVAVATVQGELEGIDLESIELVEVKVVQCVQHGDLHCANVLFDDRDHPMFIDYSAAGRAPASLDPISLELSTIFHRDAPKQVEWPTETQAEQWADVDVFAANAPFEDFIRSCRKWAFDVAGSEQEILSVGYAYALRQLKYSDTNKALARGIIRSCIARLRQGGR